MHYEQDNESPSIVQFSIHSNSKHKTIWLRSRSDMEVVDEIEVPITVHAANALRSPLSYDTSYPIINDMLSTLPLDSRQRDWFIATIISETAKIVNSDKDEDESLVGYKYLWVVNIEIEIITEIYVEESSELNGDSSGMVPANGSSIADDLEQVMVNNSIEDCCVICLEEFPMGSFFSRMPCSHVFHSNCIIKWLNTSHYCPICRFQMPT